MPCVFQQWWHAVLTLIDAYEHKAKKAELIWAFMYIVS